MAKCTEKICVTFDLSEYVPINLEIEYDDEDDDYIFLIEDKAEDIATQLLNTNFKKQLLALFKKALDEDPYIEVGYAEESSIKHPTLTKEEIRSYLQETDA